MTDSKKLSVSLKQYLLRRFRRYTVVVNRRIFRPSSDPYVSGDTFRKYSNLVFDEVKSFNPDRVKHGNIIFVKTHNFYQLISTGKQPFFESIQKESELTSFIENASYILKIK